MATRWLFVLFLAACGSSPEPEPTRSGDEAVAKVKSVKGNKAKVKAKARKPAEPVEKTTVKVFFLDRKKYDEGEEPYLIAVDREVGAKVPPRNTLAALFKGPNAEEKEQGLELVSSGASGFLNLKISEGVATLKLKGGCDASGGTLSVFDLLKATLTQFDEVDHVKLSDPEGNTADPEGEGDSRPACLEP